MALSKVECFGDGLKYFNLSHFHFKIYNIECHIKIYLTQTRSSVSRRLQDSSHNWRCKKRLQIFCYALPSFLMLAFLFFNLNEGWKETLWCRTNFHIKCDCTNVCAYWKRNPFHILKYQGDVTLKVWNFHVLQKTFNES